MRVLLALVRKDLRLFRSDKRAVIISFAVPALLAALFGFIFRSQRGADVLHIETRVVNLDSSSASRAVVQALGANPILLARETSLADAETLVRRGKVDVALVIPEGFVAAAKAAAAGKGPRPVIQIDAPPTASMELGIVGDVLEKTLAVVLAGELGAELARCATTGLPYTTERVSVSGGEAMWDGASHALAGMGVQFILIGAVDAAVRLLEERQRGLLRRMQAAPLSRALLIISRLLSGALVALAVIVFLYAFGAVLMEVRISGSPIGFGLVAVAFALMASALGVLIATFGKTPQATRGVGIFVILIATMLSGAWFPAFLFPPWMQKATLFVPSRWAVDGLDAMTWRGLGIEDALVPAGVLLLSAALCGSWAALRFRWEE